MALSEQEVTRRANNLLQQLRSRYYNPSDIPTVLASALCLVVAGRGGTEDDAHVLLAQWWETYAQDAAGYLPAD